ncbi:Hypothetical predicted protein [Olea europaea subsp. europaea]|uniref:Uncharacterized protein n=1 Tax=Olea europaea subsp. europaea TaxID=158383 RepID=A0A8S0PHS2_OLEEU|nr:Hypothetical predicted protein [Olea europaea subsp. europaea]
MPPKCRRDAPSTSRGTGKASSSSNLGHSRVDEGGLQKFLNPEHKLRFEQVVTKWIVLPEQEVGRCDNQDEEGHGDDVDIHPAPQHEPPVDTSILRHMFATMTGLSRDFQQLQASRTQEDVSDLRRCADRLIGRLDRYTGMMDDM